MGCRTDVTFPYLPVLAPAPPAIQGLGRPYSQRQNTGFLNWPFTLYRTDKVKYVSIHAMRVYGESKFTTLKILNPGPRQRWVFNFKLQLLYSWEDVLHVNWTGSTVDPSTGLNTSAKMKIVCSSLELNHDQLDFPARSLVPIPAAQTVLMLRNREPRCLRLWLSVVLIYNMIPKYQPSWVWFFVFFPLTSRQMSR